jgi:hypothetical protein
MMRLIVFASCGLLLLVIVAWWYLGRGLDRYDFSGRSPRARGDRPKRSAGPPPGHRREPLKDDRHA